MRFITLEPEEFRQFADKSPYKSFMQTPEIAKLREQNGWTTYYFGVEEAKGLSPEDHKLGRTASIAEGWSLRRVSEGDDPLASPTTIVAAAMLVAKPTFLGKSTYICPGGPLIDYEDATLVNFFFKHLKSYIKSHNGYLLHIDPYYELTERDRAGAPVENGFNHQKAVRNLKELGFQPATSTQPKYLFALNLAGRTSDQLFTEMKRNTRNHIRKAEKMGVKVRELKREELGIFKQITQSTSSRRHFTDRPLSYYEQMYDLFHDRGEVQFLVAEVKLSEGEPELENNTSKHRAGSRAMGGKKAEFGNSTTRGLSEVTTENEGASPVTTGASDPSRESAISNSAMTPLSAAMFILYGDEVVYLFSGSDEKYMKDYNAQYLIQWHMIKYAAKHKFKTYNFYGISGIPDKSNKDYGIYDFKKGFTSDQTGRVIELIGSYELPTNLPFYHLHSILSKLKHH